MSAVGGSLIPSLTLGTKNAYAMADLRPYRTQASKVQAESVQIMPTPKETLETILVVEDDEFVRRMVVKILEAANFRFLSASSGPAALKIA